MSDSKPPYLAQSDTDLPTGAGGGGAFVNTRISVSRLQIFEDCPYRFFLRYVDKTEPDDQDADFLLFGRAVHLAHETIGRWVKTNKVHGVVPKLRITQAWQHAFTEHGLLGLDVFKLGLDSLRAYFDKRIENHETLVGVELPFRYKLAEFEIVGVIDRVDRVDDETIRIIDYKTNHFLFSDEDLEADIQMALYGIAAFKSMEPKRIEFEFHMVRNNQTQSVEKTRDDMRDVAKYVVALARQTERADQAWPAKVSANCRFCEYRSKCHSYQTTLRNPVKSPSEFGPEGEIGTLVREWDHVSQRASLLYDRKRTLQEAIRRHIPVGEELKAEGFTFYEEQVREPVYELETSSEIFSMALDVPVERIREKIQTVDTEALKSLLGDVKESRDHKSLKKLEYALADSAEKRASDPVLKFKKPRRKK